MYKYYSCFVFSLNSCLLPEKNIGRKELVEKELFKSAFRTFYLQLQNLIECVYSFESLYFLLASNIQIDILKISEWQFGINV